MYQVFDFNIIFQVHDRSSKFIPSEFLVNNILADDLALATARSSAVMVLTV